MSTVREGGTTTREELLRAELEEERGKRRAAERQLNVARRMVENQAEEIGRLQARNAALAKEVTLWQGRAAQFQSRATSLGTGPPARRSPGEAWDVTEAAGGRRGPADAS